MSELNRIRKHREFVESEGLRRSLIERYGGKYAGHLIAGAAVDCAAFIGESPATLVGKLVKEGHSAWMS